MGIVLLDDVHHNTLLRSSSALKPAPRESANRAKVDVVLTRVAEGMFCPSEAEGRGHSLDFLVKIVTAVYRELSSICLECLASIVMEYIRFGAMHISIQPLTRQMTATLSSLENHLV